MTRFALWVGFVPRELAGMNIFVATLAIFRCTLEVYVAQVGFTVGRLVTGDAPYSPMRPGQRKGRLIVIEAV